MSSISVNMGLATTFSMDRKNIDVGKVEFQWNNDKSKVLIQATVTQEASKFLEEEAFKDFGMLKKGAIGLELTKLLLIAKDCIEKNIDVGKVEFQWNNDKSKVLIRATVTQEASKFLEEEAFKDFGMLKKGAIGLELTKLLLIAKDCIEKNESSG